MEEVLLLTFELFAGEDQSLLIGRDALFVLDFRLDIFDRVRRLDLKTQSNPHARADRANGRTSSVMVLPVRV